MRKIEEQVIGAFVRGHEATNANTTATKNSLYLHGNEIARRLPCGSIEVSNAGWETRTTQSRLNALCQLLGMRSKVFTKNYTMKIESINGVDVPMFGGWHLIQEVSA